MPRYLNEAGRTGLALVLPVLLLTIGEDARAEVEQAVLSDCTKLFKEANPAHHSLVTGEFAKIWDRDGNLLCEQSPKDFYDITGGAKPIPQHASPVHNIPQKARLRPGASEKHGIKTERPKPQQFKENKPDESQVALEDAPQEPLFELDLDLREEYTESQEKKKKKLEQEETQDTSATMQEFFEQIKAPLAGTALTLATLMLVWIAGKPVLVRWKKGRTLKAWKKEVDKNDDLDMSEEVLYNMQRKVEFVYPKDLMNVPSWEEVCEMEDDIVTRWMGEGNPPSSEEEAVDMVRRFGLSRLKYVHEKEITWKGMERRAQAAQRKGIERRKNAKNKSPTRTKKHPKNP